VFVKIKKVLLSSGVSLALLAGTSAFAGGPDIIAAPPCPVCVPAFTPFIYIGGSLGWAYSDWSSFIVSGFPSSADTNGFAYGGKAGFQILENFGVEAGIYGLPNANQTLTADVGPQQQPVSVSGTVKSWFAYGAGTIRTGVPTVPFLYIIAKVGGGYRALNHSGSLYDDFNTGNGSYSTVLFGGSLEYDLGGYNLPLAIGVDYLYVPSSTDSFFTTTGINADAAPAAQVVVASLSAHFAV
jgi:hypothetical protein